MATKDYHLPSKDKDKFFRGDSFNGQYSSLNLNHNKQCFLEDTVSSSKNVITNDLIFGNNLQQRNSSLSWENSKHNFSTNLYHKTFNQEREFHQNEFEIKSSNKSSNNSTLSLHIVAYENSIENKPDSSNGNKNIGIKNEKSVFVSGFAGKDQSSIEIPRQQKETDSNNPEVMQFKASQQLANPNSTIGTDGPTPSIVGTVLTESRLSIQPGFQVKEWTVLSSCGSGNGRVYKVRHRKTEEIGAMKIESLNSSIDETCLFNESKIYRALMNHTLGAKHVAEMLAFEQLEGNLNTQFLIMGFLGPNIKELKEKCGGRFGLSTVLRIGIQTLCGIKSLHDLGYVHRHLRPACFMLGNPDIPQKSRLVYVTDFTMAIPPQSHREPLVTKSYRYASTFQHHGDPVKRRDDIWSWMYILSELLGDLPWQHKQSKDSIFTLKLLTSDAQLFRNLESNNAKSHLVRALQYIRTVHADTRINYDRLQNYLKNAAVMSAGSSLNFCEPYEWEQNLQSSEGFMNDVELDQFFAHDEMKKKKVQAEKKGKSQPAPDSKESDAKKAALAAAAEKAKSAPLKCPSGGSDELRAKKKNEDNQITGEQSAKIPRAILKQKKAAKGKETKEKAGSNIKK